MFTFYLNRLFQSGSGLCLDIAASEKDVHADFFNGEIDSHAEPCFHLENSFSIDFLLEFEDLFDEDDL